MAEDLRSIDERRGFRQLKKELKSASIFFIAGISAGVFNYLFQVVAGRNLSAENFAALNGWFANLSMLFFVGGILQYASNFWPASKALLRFSIILANVLSVLAVWYWLSHPGVLTPDRAVMILVLSTLFGWLSGQVQIRMAFGVLSVTGILIALVKFGLVFMPIATPADLDRYALALFISYLPALWIITVYLWSAPAAPTSASKPKLAAPVILSAATAVIPQFDIVLMSHTVSAPQFQEFVRASLFFRALYFLIFILAQWLLPRQIQNSKSNILIHFPKIAAASALISCLLTIISPVISQYLLGWQESPDRFIIFMACLELSFLALFLLKIQELCAQGKIRAAAILMAVLAAEALGQWLFKFDVKVYLSAVTAVQGAVLIVLWRRKWA